LRSANRNNRTPDNRNNKNGFRVASTLGGCDRRHARRIRDCQNCLDHDPGKRADERSGPFMMRAPGSPGKAASALAPPKAADAVLYRERVRSGLIPFAANRP
jgi:hypothetical protein